MDENRADKEIIELRRKIRCDYPGKECALTEEEWQLEKIVDAIREEKSGLLCIGILKRGYDWIYKYPGAILLEEATDKYIGKIGTPKRDKFEAELKEEIERTRTIASVNKIREMQRRQK